MTQNLSKSNRIISYDIVRIVAIIAVVLTHASANYVTNSPIPSLDFTLGNIADSLSRLGVPLFVMLSGALLLNEQKAFTFDTMKKYIFRIFFLLYSWSFIFVIIYKIALPILRNQTLSIKAIVNALLFGHYHQWYLFMIIGIYLITPILKLFVKKENKKYIAWFIVLSLVTQYSVPLLNLLFNYFTPTTDVILDYSARYYLGFVGQYVTYYLLGWYLTNFELSKKERHLLYIFGFVGLVIAIVGTEILVKNIPNIYETLYSNLSINIFSNGILISKMSFGIYLIHPIMLTLLKYVPIPTEAIFSIPINWILATVLSFICTYCMSKIPLLKILIKN